MTASNSTEQKVIEWLLSGDTGVSSKSIIAIAFDKKIEGFGVSTPSDNSDFGRCHRLLKAIPELNELMQKNLSDYPEFLEMYVNFGAWGKLYDKQVSGDKKAGEKLYIEMKKVHKSMYDVNGMIWTLKPEFRNEK